MSGPVGVPKSLEHRIAIGATKLGISKAEYRAHIDAGEKWCCPHQEWHPRVQFKRRRAAADGLDNICKQFCRDQYAALFSLEAMS